MITSHSAGGLISADGAYCLLYCQNTDTGADGQLPGQLVVFSVANGKSVWRSNSSGNGWRTYMQQDVNFVAYRDVPAGWQGSGLDSNPNQVIWDLYPCPPSNKGDAYLSENNSIAFSSKTGKDIKQPLNYCIVMQNDGNLVIYPTGRGGPSNSVWASGSNQ